MNQAIDWLRSISLSPRLSGGKSPVCWRRDMSGNTASPAMMRRACDWIGEIAAINPKLRDGPFFGGCLDELTGPIDASPESGPGAPQSRRPRLVRSEQAPQLDRRKILKDPPAPAPFRSESDCDAPAKKHRGSFQPDEVCPAQSVTRIQPEADRSLLCRLAGDEVAVGTANQRAGGKLRKVCDTASPVSPDKTKSHRDLLCRLAERAGKSLNRSAFRSESRFQAEGLGSRNRPPEGGTPNFSPGSRNRPPEDGTPNRPPEGGTTNFSPANVLVDQWALPLDGPSVSSQALNALANERAISQAGTDDRLTRHCAGESRPSSLSLTARDGAGLGEASRRREREGADWSLADPASSEQGGFDETDQRPSAQIAPPSLTPALPALLPSQLPGVASPKVATAVSRNGARREEAEGKPDDLGELAEKIQRILNEEARRHGISV